MKLAVVIVNYNTRELLRTCLRSVADAGAREVIVVDNASSDGSCEMVHACFPDVTLVASSENRGYGAGVNRGIAVCEAPFVLVLNGDTRVSADTCEHLERYLDRHPSVAIVGPKLSNVDGTHQLSTFPFPGTLRWFLENDPFAKLAGRLPFLRRRLLRFSPPGQPQAVPWVLGAAFALRRSAFQAVGGFDESFFMYFEEVDLCWRLRNEGWEIHYDPTTTVVHVGAASTSQRWREMTLQHFSNTLHFYKRHYTGPRLFTWLTIMRTKMALRLLRDAVASVVEADAERKERLRERVTVWHRALSDPRAGRTRARERTRALEKAFGE